MNNKSKKVICFIDSFSAGGAQKQMIMLANGLIKSHVVKTLQYHNLDFFSKLLDSKIEKIKILDSIKIVRIFKLLLFFYVENPRVIISFLQGPNNYAALYKMIFFWRKTNLIVGERNLNPNGLNLKDLLVRFSHIFATHIVCNSNAQKLKLTKYFKKKLVFIPNGTIYNANAIKKYDEKNNTVKLIVPARFVHQKNPMGLIKAIQNFKNIDVHWYGEVYESFPIYKEAVDYIKNNSINNFYIKPPKDNIYEELIKYDALILPSFYEGCPNAIIDGMFCGLPILTSDVSDNRMYLSHQNKLIFNPHDVDDIVSKIKYFLSLNISELRSISHNNNLRAKKYFDVDVMISQYQKLII